MPPPTCTNHPDRLASARCPSCRRSICSECAIKIEGINVCTDCLNRRARSEERKSRHERTAGAAGSLLGVAGGILGLTAAYFLFGLLLTEVL